MGRRGHGPPPGLRQNPPGPGRYHSTLPHLPSPRPGRWTPPLSLTSASTVAMAGAPERSPAPSAAPHALAPPLSPHSSQWRRSAGQRACARQHGGPRGAPLAVRRHGGARQAAAVRLERGWGWAEDGVRRGQGSHGDRAPRSPRTASPAPQTTDSSLLAPRAPETAGLAPRTAGFVPHPRPQLATPPCPPRSGAAGGQEHPPFLTER